MLISLAAWGGQAHALGLGNIAVQSDLGRPLQAKIPVYGLPADETGTNCLKSRVLTLEGGVLSRPVSELVVNATGAVLSLRSVESINEPVVNLSVEIGCTSSVKREYQILLDPAPATLPIASTAGLAQNERPERAERKSAAQPGAMVSAIRPDPTSLTGSMASPPLAAKPPESVVRKPAAPARPKPAAEMKSVLTLTSGDAEIEQVRARIALRSATTLSEPRVETDPARLAALRADQARIAALLRGEDPLAGTKAQLLDAQGKLLAAQKSAASAASLHAQEKAALMAAQENMAPTTLAAALGALLLACIAAIAWLLWRRAEDRRRQEQAFFAMTAEQDAPPAVPVHREREEQDVPAGAPPASAGAPVFEPAPKAEPLDFPMPADDFEPAPPPALRVYEWHPDSAVPTVSSTPPQSLQLPDSWLALEKQIEETRDGAPRAADLPPTLPTADDKAHAHAAEVAGMLLTAEDWMAEHNPMRAAEVLRPYLDRDGMQSPAPGLYLLSLYRTMDNNEQINAVLAQMQQHFPAEAADWANISRSRCSVADFPLVHFAVDSLSDTDKLLPYLNSLLLAPERFDFSTYREIVRAIGLAKTMQQEGDMQTVSLDFK